VPKDGYWDWFDSVGRRVFLLVRANLRAESEIQLARGCEPRVVGPQASERLPN
jgi:hypothetical protein